MRDRNLSLESKKRRGGRTSLQKKRKEVVKCAEKPKTPPPSGEATPQNFPPPFPNRIMIHKRGERKGNAEDNEVAWTMKEKKEW